MEFISKLDEGDFMLSGGIAVKLSRSTFDRVFKWIYPFVFICFIWCTFLLGMILEWFNRTKGGLVQLPLGHMVLESFGPTAILYYLMVIALRPLERWPLRKRRRERFRTNPACQEPTTVTLSSDSISFRSTTGMSQSHWECYESWGEKSGIVVLLTQAGVRQMVKISELPSEQQQEFRNILTEVLPQK